MICNLHCVKMAGFIVLYFNTVQAGIPWLISEDDRNSWFSGPVTKCYFSRKWYSVGASFCPVLHPFGRMPCMNCTCLKHPQFPFLRPRVNCRNVRSECPLASCADPVTKDGECCPSCHKEYISLVLPTTENLKNRDVGRLHLTLARDSLFICVKIEGVERIVYLKLKDKNSGFVYQHYREGDFKASFSIGKVCISANLPNTPIDEPVRRKRMVVEIGSRETVYRGLLTYHHMFSEVPFLAMLSPYEFAEKTAAIAGIATMSGDKSKGKMIIKLSLLFKSGGLKLKGYPKDGSVVMKMLKRPWKPDKLSPVLKTYSFKVTKEEIMNDEQLVKQFEWKNPRAAHFRWMVRGILFVTVDFEFGNQASRLLGRVLIHDSCRTFYSVLNGGGLDPPKSTMINGVATMRFGARTKLHYKVTGKGTAKSYKTDVLVVDMYENVLKKLATIKRDPGEDVFQASGIWEKPSAEAISLLFKGAIFIKFSSNIKSNENMRGRMRQSLYLNEANYARASIISIHDVDTKASSKTSAAVVISADSNCNVHYVLFISGYGESSTAYKLVYAFLRLDGIFTKGRKESTEIKLNSFNENYITRGSIMAPSEDLLIGIATGMAHIEIHTRRFVTQELKGQVSFANNECRKIKKVKANSFLQRSFVGSDLNVGVCLHQERFHDDGSEWNPIGGDGTTKMYCTICKCDRQHVTCRRIVCPKPNCLNPVQAREHCCPVCTSPPNGRAINPRKACIVGMASRNDIRGIGEAWHPVIPPFGMMKCIVCICKTAPGGHICTRVECPVLHCKRPERVQGSCCPVCPSKKRLKSDNQRKQSKQETHVSREKANCLHRGKSYLHGTSWKPILPQFGMLQCVICRCKNGKVRCRRLRCMKSARCRMRNGKMDPCCRHCTALRKS